MGMQVKRVYLACALASIVGLAGAEAAPLDAVSKSWVCRSEIRGVCIVSSGHCKPDSVPNINYVLDYSTKSVSINSLIEGKKFTTKLAERFMTNDYYTVVDDVGFYDVRDVFTLNHEHKSFTLGHSDGVVYSWVGGSCLPL
jgi:hypothetical protein